MLNQITIMGRLTRDPELRRTGTGLPVASFTVAVDRDWPNKVTTNEIILRGHDGADINTLEGVMHANLGDFIIKGVKGEIYPCKPDIFMKTYERVESNEELNYG